jgi:hypothetical protein
VRWRGVLDDTDEMRVDERWRRRVWCDEDEDKEEEMMCGYVHAEQEQIGHNAGY